MSALACLNADSFLGYPEEQPRGALLPSLDKAHKGLLDTQIAVDQVDTELSLLQKAQAKLDVRHDRKRSGSAEPDLVDVTAPAPAPAAPVGAAPAIK